MQGKATIAGHPIHPMLIPFPIAFFVGALGCDIISIWNAALNWHQIAEVLIGFGIIGGLMAATFGFIDYFTAPLSEGARRTATSHMLLNLLMVTIFVAAFLLRFREPTAIGYWLTAIGNIVLLSAGFLGGKLVFEDAVGVAEQSPPTSSSRRTTHDEISESYVRTNH